jgi:D-alanyl-D-alanine carboxypeptidase (penicillin-binding protein 5/6)
LKGKISIAIITILLCSTILYTPAYGQFETPADNAVLMEYSTGNIVYRKNADVPKPPASITKLMTLLLTFEAIEREQVNWDTVVTVSENAWRLGGSTMYLEIGDKLTIRELVTGISVVSANDACVAVAEHLYGSEGTFVREMNKRAEEIGLKNTSFKNSTGLPAENHVMSAEDIALLSRYLIFHHPMVLEFESMRSFTYRGITQHNRNPLLNRYQGADGLKTGWTTEAGFCLTATAEREGLRFIGVILNTVNERERNTAAQELLNYGFNNFIVHTVASKGDVVDSITIIDGRRTTVTAMPLEDINVAIKVEMVDQLELRVVRDGQVRAPIKEGDRVAQLEVRLEDNLLTKSDLVATEDVARANILVRLLRRIAGLFKITRG